jgi:hypothetical protein
MIIGDDLPAPMYGWVNSHTSEALMHQSSDEQHLLIVMETLDAQIQRFVRTHGVPTRELERVAAALQISLGALIT